MRQHALLAAILAAIAPFQLQAAPASPSAGWPANSPSHRKIFCGIDGAEISHAYSQALNLALKREIRRGANLVQAMDSLRERAKCPAGSHLPSADLVEIVS